MDGIDVLCRVLEKPELEIQGCERIAELVSHCRE
jgi:hypothetical protein